MERIEHHVCFLAAAEKSGACGDRHADDFFRAAAAGKTEKCPSCTGFPG